MSFNDSFGQYDDNNLEEEEENKNNGNISLEENKNNEGNNISFEMNKINNNNDDNISFEENKNNNMSFDNMKIDENNIGEEEEQKKNDIFNSLPMEIQNQDNEKKIFYENLYIKENIKNNLYKMILVFENRIFLNKTKFFYELKYRADYKYEKLVRAEIVLMSIQNKLNIFNHIEKFYRYKMIKESFVNLKNYRKLIKYKDEQDKIKEEEMKKKIKDMNDKLKKDENNLKDISDNVNKLKDKEKVVNNGIEELNKKYNKLNEKYNSLIQKSKMLKENIKQKMANYSITLDKTIDPKIAELQNIIKNKEKEKEKSINYFEEFYNKMNDMIGIYESHYETMKSASGINNE